MRVTWLLVLPSRRGFIGNLAIAALTCAMLVEPAQPARGDSVDDYIGAEIARRKIPGLALAVIQRGQVVKLAGYGLASVELDAPVTPDTVFELASVTKQFTAAAVMKLVEDGKVALPGLTAAMRPNMAEIKRVLGKRIAELRSFAYITTDVREANAEWLGVPIRGLVHYQMVTASETRYDTFWLTADGRVADFTSYAE